MNEHWSSFTKRITILADPAEIYRAWATPAGLESWFLREAIFQNTQHTRRGPREFIQPRDHYTWLWYGHPDNVVENNQLLEANGSDLLRFGFTGDTIVTVKIIEEQNTPIVELTQTGIPFAENPNLNLYIGCGEGWTFYLANLKSLLEGGVDLRNKHVGIKQVINS